MGRRREREGREERRQPPRPAAVWQRDVSRAAAAASNPTHVHVHDHRPCHIETLNCRRPVGPCIYLYLSIYLEIAVFFAATTVCGLRSQVRLGGLALGIGEIKRIIAKVLVT